LSQESITEAQPVQNAQVLRPQGAIDGVFANVTAVSEQSKGVDNPPPYSTVPFHGLSHTTQPIVVTQFQSGDEPLVDGMRVGGGLTFFFSMLGSWLFGIIAFLLIFILSGTHAGKNGARAGLGLLVVQIGVWLSMVVIPAYEADQRAQHDAHKHTILNNLPIVLSYLFVFLGWIVVIRSFAQYLHARRIRTAILTTPSV